VLKRVRPIELRYYLVAAHYRSTSSSPSRRSTRRRPGFRRIEGFLDRAGPGAGAEPPMTCPPAFTAAMDDDLGTPAAVAVLHDAVREGNTAARRRRRRARTRARGGRARDARRARPRPARPGLAGEPAARRPS
jgi:cysteinyl-tRNA synthetase